MEPRHRNCCSESRSQRLSRPPAPTHALSFSAGSRIAYRRSASAPCASVTDGVQHARARNNWAMQTTAGEVASCSGRLMQAPPGALLRMGPPAEAGAQGAREEGRNCSSRQTANTRSNGSSTSSEGVPVSRPRRWLSLAQPAWRGRVLKWRWFDRRARAARPDVGLGHSRIRRSVLRLPRRAKSV